MTRHIWDPHQMQLDNKAHEAEMQYLYEMREASSCQCDVCDYWFYSCEEGSLRNENGWKMNLCGDCLNKKMKSLLHKLNKILVSMNEDAKALLKNAKKIRTALKVFKWSIKVSNYFFAAAMICFLLAIIYTLLGN